MTPHINAKDGAFAKTVLMPGDPLRAKLLADTFLENAELVTDVRNIYGYTGTYKGVPVSVMASGMGMPSIGIYSWELYSFYGVENIIRIGSAGSYSAQLDVLDVVLAKEAYSESSFAKTLSGYDKDTILPSQHVNDVIIQAAKDADVLITDVWASMGQEDEAEKRRKAFEGYQINDDIMAVAKEDAMVLHCLPAHREEEITEKVFEAHAKEIFEEAENRLHAQKAVMVKLMA